jgi:hypothetical protein
VLPGENSIRDPTNWSWRNYARSAVACDRL